MFLISMSSNAVYTGIEQSDFPDLLKVYPNPSDRFMIELMEFNKIVPYEVTDIFGRTLTKGDLYDKHSSLDLSGFDAGIYLLRVNDKVVRLIKQ